MSNKQDVIDNIILDDRLSIDDIENLLKDALLITFNKFFKLDKECYTRENTEVSKIIIDDSTFKIMMPRFIKYKDETIRVDDKNLTEFSDEFYNNLNKLHLNKF